MFKGSKNVEPEGHPSWISSVGGQSNAYTNEDSTVFWQTFPAQYLPLVLWLEADRMASLRIEEKVFQTEREVVKEERRMRVENQPYGRLNEIVYDQAFKVHPYKHPVIGSMKDLEAASIDDVREFFRTYYVPNNATLVLVGDFDTKEASELVQRYLGRIPKSSKPVPRDIPQEPPQTQERRVRLEESWPLPAVVVAHHITFDGHTDSYPLHIASKVLSDGESSRIYRKLVYEKQLALAAFGGGNIIEHPNLFFAVAIVQPGQKPEDAVNALIAELDRLKSEPISAAELQQAKNQFARDYILGRESNKDKASASRPRRGDPQRHQDGGRRVRHLHEHRRPPTCSAWRRPTSSRKTGWCSPSCLAAPALEACDEPSPHAVDRLRAVRVHAAGRIRGSTGGGLAHASGRRARCPRGMSSSLRTSCGPSPTVFRSSPCRTTSSRPSVSGC